MIVNVKKTSTMTVGTRQSLHHIDILEIFLNGTLSLQDVDNQKLLGILIDKSLTFESQIDSVCSNTTRRITLLKLLSKTLIKLT